jgi:hypothetical protein
LTTLTAEEHDEYTHYLPGWATAPVLRDVSKALEQAPV